MNFNFLKNKEVKNAGWLIGEQIVQMMVSLIVGVLSARYLGPTDYGILNYTASFVTLFTCFCTLGMESVIIKKLVEAPDKEGEYLGSCICFRFISSLLSTVGIALLVFVLNPSEPIKVMLALIQSLQLIFKSFHLFENWFQRHLKSKFIAIGKMLSCILVAVYKVFLLITAKNIIWFAFANSLAEGILIFVLFFFYKKERGQKIVVSLKKGKEVLSLSYHFILSGLMVALYSQMDKIMIGKILTDEEVGLYSTALQVSGMWIFVPMALISSFQPKIYELKQQGAENQYLERLKQLYGIVIWFCLIISVIVALLANFIIRILYGEAYSEAGNILRIAVWSEIFSMIGSMRGIWIVNEGKQKYVKYYLGCGVVVNFLLNLVLIPLIGINGAAIATLITQIITSLIAPLLFKETRNFTGIVMESVLLKSFLKKEKEDVD